MAIKVTVPTRRGGVVTTTTSTSKVQTATKLEGLANVDLEGAQDGYTFTFNADTGKWEATPVSGLAISSDNIQNLDGGTY